MTASPKPSGRQDSSKRPPPPYADIKLSDETPAILRELILSYLVFNCYEETAKSFARGISHGKVLPPASLSSASRVASKASPNKAASDQGDAMMIDSVPSVPSTSTLQSQSSWESIISTLKPSISPNTSATVVRQLSTTSAASTGKASASVASRKSAASTLDENDDEMAVSFNAGASSSPHNNGLLSIISSLVPRKEIGRKILDGRLLEAIDLCKTHFPAVIIDLDSYQSAQPSPPADKAIEVKLSPVNIAFQLHSLHFIELVRQGKQMEALMYAQNTLKRFTKISFSFDAQLKEVGALLAYEKPENSPLASFLDQSRRQEVADLLNSAILVSLNQQPKPSLEAIVQQVTVCHNSFKPEPNLKDKKAAKNVENPDWKLQDLLETTS